MLVDPAHRDDRLTELGTTVEILEQVVRAGDYGWRRATEDHGVGAGAQFAYRFRLAELRRLQRQLHQWENDAPLQIELTVDPQHTIAIQTIMGDEHTGEPRGAPRTSSPRGENGRAILQQAAESERQGKLFEVAVDPEADTDSESRRFKALDVWILLVHRREDKKTGEVTWMSELSRPGPPDGKGYIVHWTDRIILPPIQFDAPVIDREDDEDDGFGEFDIPIDFR